MSTEKNSGTEHQHNTTDEFGRKPLTVYELKHSTVTDLGFQVDGLHAVAIEQDGDLNFNRIAPTTLDSIRKAAQTVEQRPRDESPIWSFEESATELDALQEKLEKLREAGR